MREVGAYSQWHWRSIGNGLFNWQPMLILYLLRLVPTALNENKHNTSDSNGATDAVTTYKTMSQFHVTWKRQHTRALDFYEPATNA